MDRQIRPCWWKLYLILALGVGLMALVARTRLSDVGHEITECGLLLLIYGSVALWLRASKLGQIRPSSREGSRLDGSRASSPQASPQASPQVSPQAPRSGVKAGWKPAIQPYQK